jgi:hypothetical protein
MKGKEEMKKEHEEILKECLKVFNEAKEKLEAIDNKGVINLPVVNWDKIISDFVERF